MVLFDTPQQEKWFALYKRAFRRFAWPRLGISLRQKYSGDCLNPGCCFTTNHTPHCCDIPF